MTLGTIFLFLLVAAVVLLKLMLLGVAFLLIVHALRTLLTRRRARGPKAP